MTTTSIPTSLLVGSHFRPPAKVLLAHLPAGQLLRLEAEPGNPYDEHAIRVMLRSADIPASQHGSLAESLPSQGFELEQVLAEEEWQIGYVAATGGKPLVGTDFAGNQEFAGFLNAAGGGWCRLGFSPEGRPTIQPIPAGSTEAE